MKNGQLDCRKHEKDFSNAGGLQGIHVCVMTISGVGEILYNNKVIKQ